MKLGLFILGVLILLVTFSLMSGFSESKESILRTQQSCDSSIGGIAKWLSDDVIKECHNNRYPFFIITYGFSGYVIGGILAFLGLVIPKRKTEEDEEVEETPKERKQFCTKCGTEKYSNEKYCPECGEKEK